MKRTAALIALLLAAAPACAADAGDEDVRVFERGLTIRPDLELPAPEIPLPELDENRPFPVNKEVYEKVRRHLEKYGGEGLTSDGNPARCVRGEGSAIWITACMNFAYAEPAGEGVRAIPAVLRWYTGPVEVQVTELKGEEMVCRVYYLSTVGNLETLVETAQPAATLDIPGAESAETTVSGRTIAPSSVEALMSWDETAKIVLSLVPQIRI